jgi:hypothetical protein
MLPLDSARWAQLEHAYGCATESASAPTGWSADSGFRGHQKIPNLLDCLRELEASPGKLDSSKWEPWGTLVSSLCHQGSIYSASFAAIPHIVDIGLRSAPKWQIDCGFFLLPTLVEQGRLEGQQPAVAEDIMADYLMAVRQLPELAYAVREQSWSLEFVAVVAAALAASKGQLRLSKCMLELTDEREVNEFWDWRENR